MIGQNKEGCSNLIIQYFLKMRKLNRYMSKKLYESSIFTYTFVWTEHFIWFAIFHL